MRLQLRAVPKEIADRVGELYRLGLTYAEIGARLDMTRYAVGGILKRMRMLRPKHKPAVPIDDIAPLWAAGYRIVVIASMLGATPSAISSRVDNARNNGDMRFPMRNDSRRLRKADQLATLRVPCLTCRRPFQSEGPGNRMCANCKLNAEDVSPYDPGVMESRGRRVVGQSVRVG